MKLIAHFRMDISKAFGDLGTGPDSSILSLSDPNLSAPLYHEYLQWLPAEHRDQAWRQLSYAASRLDSSKKYEFTNALLVTFRDPVAIYPVEGTFWGAIILEAAEKAISNQQEASSAQAMLSSVLMLARMCRLRMAIY